MKRHKMKRGGAVIFLSVIFTIILMIRPVPLAFESYRPDWIILIAIYWAMALPHRYNIGLAWLTGLTLDLLLGSALGVQAFALSFVVYLAASNFQLIRNMSLWQQAIIVCFFDFLYRLFIFILENIVNDAQIQAEYFWPVLTTSVVWPWVFLLMRKIRRKFKVQ